MSGVYYPVVWNTIRFGSGLDQVWQCNEECLLTLNCKQETLSFSLSSMKTSNPGTTQKANQNQASPDISGSVVGQATSSTERDQPALLSPHSFSSLSQIEFVGSVPSFSLSPCFG